MTREKPKLHMHHGLGKDNANLPPGSPQSARASPAAARCGLFSPQPRLSPRLRRCGPG